MATARRRRIREQRKLRKEGPKKTYYGGSKEREEAYRKENDDIVFNGRHSANEGYDALDKQLERTQTLEGQATRDYAKSKRTAESSRSGYAGSIEGIGAGANDAIGIRNQALGSAIGMRDNALATNQLTGSAENILAQRQAQLAGVPTIGQATNTAIAAQAAGANAMVANQTAQQARAARGLAGSMGEGGALAMQQAMATAGAGAADQAAASQLAQAQLSAQMRFGAAQTQNAQDVAAADQAVALRMGAAEQERAAQLGFADANANAGLAIGDANAGNKYDAALQTTNAKAGLMTADMAGRQEAGGFQAQLLGQSNDMASNKAQLGLGELGMALNNRLGMEGAVMGQAASDNAAAYAAAQANSPMAKLQKVATLMG